MQTATRSPALALDSECYSYGGVGFEILQAGSHGWELGADHQLFVSRGTEPTCAQVRVAVTVDPSLDLQAGDRTIDWRWEGDHALVRTIGVSAHLQRVAPGSYVAAARVGTRRAAESSLTTALSGVIVGREGGLVLHAAGVVVDGAAVLFIGPSGAGKTTASNHTAAGRWHARDRAAIYPFGNGWWTWGMAGGDDIHLPRAEKRTYPLAGVMRVRRGHRGVTVTDLDATKSLYVLRESAQWAQAGVDEEGRLLDACMAVASAVPVAELHSVLDHDLTSTLSEWSRRRRNFVSATGASVDRARNK